MSIPASALRRVVTPQTPDDAKRIVEIAVLAVASDGTLAPEELTVLRSISGELKAYSNAELDVLIGAVLGGTTRDDRVDRLRTLASALGSEKASHCAYQVSVLTALSDLATADEEFEFDLDIQEALQLAPDVADKLSAEVNELLMVPE